jgi:hypothetical protein
MATPNQPYFFSGLGDTLGNLGTGVKNAAISLFAPSATATGDYTSRSAEIARQQKLADMLTQMGAQDIPVSTVGGITAPISPWAALAKGLQSGAGSYMSAKAAGAAAGLTAADRANAMDLYKQAMGSPEVALGQGISQGAPTTGKYTLPLQMPDIGAGKGPVENVDIGMPTPGRFANTVTPAVAPLDMAGRRAAAMKALIGGEGGAATETMAKLLMQPPETRNLSEYGSETTDPLTGKVLLTQAGIVKPANKTPFAAVVNGKPGMFVYDDAGKPVAVPGMTPFRAGEGSGNGGPFSGNSMPAQLGNVLMRGNTSSPEYAYAYEVLGKPQTTIDPNTNQIVTIPGIDLSRYPKPIYATPSSGGTPQTRDIKVAAAVIEPEKVRAARTTLTTFNSQMDVLKNALNKVSPTDKALYLATGVKKGGMADVIGAYNAGVMIVRDKELADTGVLQAGELAWLNGFMTNPGTLLGIISGADATMASFNQMGSLIKNKLSAKQQNYGGPSAPSVTPAPGGAADPGGATPAPSKTIRYEDMN